MQRFAHVAAVTVMLASAACLELDEEALVHDLRLLAVKTEPAEILLGAAVLGGAPSGGPPGAPLPAAGDATPAVVDVEVFAYDPRKGVVNASLFFCPPEQDESCEGYDVESGVLAGVAEGERAAFEAVFLPTRVSTSAPDVDELPAGRVTSLALRYELTTPVLRALATGALGVPRLGVAPIQPRVVVALEAFGAEGVNGARGFKRLPLSWDLFDPSLAPAQLEAALAPYGITLCSNDVQLPDEEGPAECLRPRRPNENPRLTGFALIDDDELAEEEATFAAGERVPAVTLSERPELGPNPVLLVDPGAVLRVRPVFAPGAEEAYQALVSDPDEEATFIEDRFEDFACNWYVTAGSSTFETRSRASPGPGAVLGDERLTLDTVWQLPASAELDDDEARDALVLVARDQRGGVAVGQLTVEYRR